MALEDLYVYVFVCMYVASLFVILTKQTSSISRGLYEPVL